MGIFPADGLKSVFVSVCLFFFTTDSQCECLKYDINGLLGISGVTVGHIEYVNAQEITFPVLS